MRFRIGQNSAGGYVLIVELELDRKTVRVQLVPIDLTREERLKMKWFEIAVKESGDAAI